MQISERNHEASNACRKNGKVNPLKMNMCMSHRRASSFSILEWKIISGKNALMSVGTFRLKALLTISLRAAATRLETRSSSFYGPSVYLNQVEILKVVPAHKKERAVKSAISWNIGTAFGIVHLKGAALFNPGKLYILRPLLGSTLYRFIYGMQRSTLVSRVSNSLHKSRIHRPSFRLEP